MVTDEEYARFQEEHDRQHPLNPDGTPASTRVTDEEYALWQDHLSRGVEIPNDPSTNRPTGHRHPTQAEYTRFQNSFGRVSAPAPKTRGVLVLESEEYKEEQKSRSRQQYESDPKMRKLNLEDYKKALEEREKRTQEAIAEMRRKNAERERKQKRIESNPLLSRLAKNAYGGKEAQEKRRKEVEDLKRARYSP